MKKLMKILMKNFKLIVIFLNLFLSFSCKVSYNSLLDEYNSLFDYDPNAPVLVKIGDPGFDEGCMIPYSLYDVEVDTILYIVAPEGSSKYGETSYSWELKLGETSVSDLQSGREFNMLFSSADFMVGEKYVLTLTAKNNSGEYTDKANIILFKK